jgi:hypothetical protein
MKALIISILFLPLIGCAPQGASDRYRLIPVKDEVGEPYRTLNQHSQAWLLDTESGRVAWCTAANGEHDWTSCTPLVGSWSYR